MKALQIAATGMSAQQMKVDVVSNNLANMSTTGYNARRADFADLHYQQLARPGTVSASDGSMLPTGIQIGLGVRPSSVSIVLAQGSLALTGGPALAGLLAASCALRRLCSRATQSARAHWPRCLRHPDRPKPATWPDHRAR